MSFNLKREAAPQATELNDAARSVAGTFQSQTRSRSPSDNETDGVLVA